MYRPNQHWHICRPIRVVSGLEIKLAVDLDFQIWTRRTFRLHGLAITSTADPTAAQHALTAMVSSVQRLPEDRPPTPPLLLMQSFSVPGILYTAILYPAHPQQLIDDGMLDDSLNSLLLEQHPEIFIARNENI